MNQVIAIDDNQVEFLKRFSRYGFKSEGDLVKVALERLRNDMERKSLEESANIYADIYANDEELREITESALMETVDD